MDNVEQLYFFRPHNAGIESSTEEVGKRLSRLMNALEDEINSNIGSGPLLDIVYETRFKIFDGLRAEGWTMKWTVGKGLDISRP